MTGPALDRGVRAAGLWCFPDRDDPRSYHHVPEAAHLATDAEGVPKLSLLRYVSTESSEGPRADGGAVLHLLVSYATPEERAAEAETALREELDDPEIRLDGPLSFDAGRYRLVSSILDASSVLATGAAPVLEGQEIALSFRLEPEASRLLLESFETAAPDVSVVFELDLGGWTDAYQARLHVDWTRVTKRLDAGASGRLYMISAEVRAQVDDLFRENAVRLETAGEHEPSEALVARAMERVTELLYEPAAPETLPPAERAGWADALKTLGSAVELGDALPDLSLSLAYRAVDRRTQGTTVLDLSHRSRVTRPMHLVLDLGDLAERWGDDPRVFRTVRLDDPAFEQREIHLAVDGALVSELGELINHVSVELWKSHEGGPETRREQVIRNPADGRAFTYGWYEDHDRAAWLRYRFRTRWSFRGGGVYESPWTETDAPMIDVYAPYRRHRIEVLPGDAELSDLGVRAVVVEVTHPFFGETRRVRRIWRPGAELPEPLEIPLPRDLFAVDYRLTYLFADGIRQEIVGSDDSGLIFLDGPPVWVALSA